MNRGVLAVAVLASVFWADSAHACSCMTMCEESIAVGNVLPENATGVALAKCGRYEMKFKHVHLDRLIGDKRQPVAFRLESTEYGAIVKPMTPWKKGERYSLFSANGWKKFHIVSPIELDEIVVTPKASLGLPAIIAEPTGVQCTSDTVARKYEVELEITEEFEPFREMLMVNQTVDGKPWRYRKSMCSSRQNPHAMRDDPYLFAFNRWSMFRWRDEPCTEVTPGYEVSLAGLDIPVRVEASPTVGGCFFYIPNDSAIWLLLVSIVGISAFVFRLRKRRAGDQDEPENQAT